MRSYQGLMECYLLKHGQLPPTISDVDQIAIINRSVVVLSYYYRVVIVLFYPVVIVVGDFPADLPIKRLLLRPLSGIETTPE